MCYIEGVILKEKYFIITIDTEGDNLWTWSEGDTVQTNNAKYLPRFQELCNKYGNKVVWLANWEMIHDQNFVSMAIEQRDKGNCEIGMHIHAWNNPPIYQLPIENPHCAPYLIEYPENIMRAKIEMYINDYEKIFGSRPLSHRAGRWAMTPTYFRLLEEYGIKVDCSYTPGIDWKKSVGQTKGSVGSDYRSVSTIAHYIGNVLEVPMSIRTRHYLNRVNIINWKTFIKECYKLFFGRRIWLRPNGNNSGEMEWIIEKTLKDPNMDVLMFMIHSSELMPGGSLAFATEKEIDCVYNDIESIFKLIDRRINPITLSQFYELARYNKG